MLKRNVSAEVTIKDVHSNYVEVKFCNNGTESLLSSFIKNGSIPLLPIFKGSKVRQKIENYQAVFASHYGVVVVPTAGLHFNQDLLGKIVAKGVKMEFLTLQFWACTFYPIKTEKIAEHVMHAEDFAISKAMWTQ